MATQNKKLTFKEKLLRFTKLDRKRNDKTVGIGLVVMAVILVLSSITYNTGIGASNVTTSAVDKSDNVVFTATFVGDMVFDRYVERVTDVKGYEYVFKDFQQQFLDSDIVMGNLENPLVTEETRENDDLKADGKEIAFGAPIEAAQAMADAGIDLVSLANNHMMDYTEVGIKETIEALNEAEISYVGAGVNKDEAMNVDYTTVNGVTIATFGMTATNADGSATQNTAGPLKGTSPNINQVMKSIDDEGKADIVIAQLHWGEEYATSPNSKQKELAEELIDEGVDIIIGHHPHVVQPIEIVETQNNTGIVFYSLGNFILDQSYFLTKEAIAVQYTLYDDGVGEFRIIPTYIEDSRPVPIFENTTRARTINSRLTPILDAQDEEYRVENGSIVIEMDHSKFLSTTTGVTTAELTLREDPIIEDGNVIKYLPVGETVTILDEENGWYRVEHENSFGWVSADYVEIEGNEVNEEPEIEAPIEDEAEENESDNIVSYERYTTTEIRLREEPNTTSDVLDIIATNTVVTVTEDLGEWIGVSVNGYDGYIMKQYTSETQAEVSEPETSIPSQVKIDASVLTLRAEASQNAAAIGSIAQGEIVTVIESDNGWYKVSYQGAEGYISADYVSVVE